MSRNEYNIILICPQNLLHGVLNRQTKCIKLNDAYCVDHNIHYIPIIIINGYKNVKKVKFCLHLTDIY